MSTVLSGIPERDPGRIAAKLAAGDRPWVALKAAVSLDGKIATARGESRWITGETARSFAHCLRALHDGVLVGIGTVLADNPRLTARLPGAEARPARIVLDSRGRLPPDAAVLAEDGAPRLVVVGSEAPPESVATLLARGVILLACETARPRPARFLPWLREQGVRTLLVEGGGTVQAELIAHGEADELFLLVSGKVMGDPTAPAWCGALGLPRLADAPRFRLSPPRAVGEDVLIHGLIER